MEILKELREQNGFAQKDVAKQLNITPSSYHCYEAGKRQPTPEMLCKLADVFEVSVDYLLGREQKNTALTNKDGISDVALNYVKEFSDILGEKNFKDFSRLYQVMNNLQKVYMLAYMIGYLNKAGINTKNVIGY